MKRIRQQPSCQHKHSQPPRREGVDTHFSVTVGPSFNLNLLGPNRFTSLDIIASTMLGVFKLGVPSDVEKLVLVTHPFPVWNLILAPCAVVK